VASPRRCQSVPAHSMFGFEVAGSTAERRRNSRLILGATPRFWPEKKTRVIRQHRVVDQLDIDAVGHGWRDAGREFNQLAGRGFRVGVGAFGRELHKGALARFGHRAQNLIGNRSQRSTACSN
jgi:hypothetical protein